MAAVAFVSGVPADRIDGYVVVTYDRENGPKVDATACCQAHILVLLTDLAATMAVDLAHPLEGTPAG